MECLKIHEEVRLIDGFLRSVAYDLPRGEFLFLPKPLSLFLKKNDKKSVNTLKKDSFFNNYLNYLLDNEIVFIEDRQLMQNFPKLNLEWKSPSEVINCIINFKSLNLILLKKQLEIINGLNVKHLHFNLLNIPRKDELIEMINTFNSSGLQSIDFLISNGNKKQINIFLNICAKYPRVRKIYIPDSFNIDFKTTLKNFLSIIYYNTANNSSSIIYNFTVNISLFTESQNHNVYFNRKIFINEEGLLKNAPECAEKFGNIVDIKNIQQLKKIVTSKKFKEKSLVNKDKCDVCKDCEFRYMCNDNRVPNKRKNNEWYYDLECAYNPYIAKWKNEDGYKSLDECGVKSNKIAFRINHKLINSINKELWDND